MNLLRSSLNFLKLGPTAVGLILTASGAHAANPTPVTSNASDISVDIGIASLLSGSIGPFATASGVSTTGAPTYSSTSTLVSASASGDATVIGDPDAVIAATGLGLSSGTLSAAASGTAHGSTATSTVEDLVLDLVASGATVLSIGGADSDIVSTSSAQAPLPLGIPTASGSSTVTNVTLDALGTILDLSATASTPANTVVTLPGDLLGLLTITLNEQTITHPLNGLAIQTDAIDIDLNGLGAVTGNIVIGQSFAQVPEPGTWAMMLIGIGSTGGLCRANARRCRRTTGVA